MHLEHRVFGSALAAHVTLALCLSCSSSDSPESDDIAPNTSDNTSSAGTLGATGNMSATATGTTGSTGTTGPGTSAGPTTSASITATGSQATTTTGTGGATGGDGAVGTGGASTTGTGGASGGITGGSTGGGSGGASTAATSTTGGTEPAPSSGCDSPAGLSSGPASIDVDGLMRDYILLVPDDYDPSHPYKLIFGFHPWGGSAQQTANMGYFGVEDVSDGQAILVAPEGLDFQGNGLGWGNENGRDVAFYKAMRDLFIAELCIDQNRIFSTGFSFGAMFSFTLACTQDSMIRAIAPQAGNAMVAGCESGERSVATMAFIGVDDSLIDGHRQAVQTFVGRNGCDTEPVMLQTSWCDGLASQFEPCTCVEYPNCAAGQPVIECEYKAGHQFAPTSGQTIWDFFAQF